MLSCWLSYSLFLPPSPSIHVFHLLSIHSIWYLLLLKAFLSSPLFPTSHCLLSNIQNSEEKKKVRWKKKDFPFIHFLFIVFYCPVECFLNPTEYSHYLVVGKSLFIKTILCQDDHHTRYFCHVFFFFLGSLGKSRLLESHVSPVPQSSLYYSYSLSY